MTSAAAAFILGIIAGLILGLIMLVVLFVRGGGPR